MQPSCTTPSLAVRDVFTAEGTQRALKAKRDELERKLNRIVRSRKIRGEDRDSETYKCVLAYARSVFVGLVLHFQKITEGPGADFGEAYSELLSEIGRWTKQEAARFWHDLTGRPMPPDFGQCLEQELERYVKGHAPGTLKIVPCLGPVSDSLVAALVECGEVLLELSRADENPADETATPDKAASGCVRLAPAKLGNQRALLGLSINALAGDRNTCQPSWKTWLRAKDGEPIRRCKADMIVRRLNRLLAERGLRCVTLSDLQ